MALFIERVAELDVILRVPAAFVAPTEVVDPQTIFLRAIQPREGVADIVVGPESIAQPTGCAPGEAAEFYLRITRFGFFHQPPFIAEIALDFVRRALMTWLRAAGSIRVCANFDFQDLQCRAVVRL